MMTKIKCILAKEMRLLMTMTRRWYNFESNLPRAWTHAATSNKAKRPIVRYCHMMISASYPDRSQLPSLYILPPTSVARSFLKHRLFLNVGLRNNRSKKCVGCVVKVKVIDGYIYPERNTGLSLRIFSLLSILRFTLMNYYSVT